MRRQARGQATRIRLRALREAADLGGRMTELARRFESLRERPLDSLQTAIARIGAEEEAEEIRTSNGRVLRSADQLFDGMVEIEVGPLADFSQFVGFEDAAEGSSRLEISVKRFRPRAGDARGEADRARRAAARARGAPRRSSSGVRIGGATGWCSMSTRPRRFEVGPGAGVGHRRAVPIA